MPNFGFFFLDSKQIQRPSTHLQPGRASTFTFTFTFITATRHQLLSSHQLSQFKFLALLLCHPNNKNNKYIHIRQM